MRAGILDLLLAAAMPLLAAATLLVRSRFGAVAPFLSFGLVVALAWARLDAPDVALAEAALGAGITSALLVREARRRDPARDGGRADAGRLAPAVLLGAGAAAGLAAAVLALPPPDGVVPALAREALARTGVKNPVTAVLLDYRGVDTLVEVVVLLLALIAAWAVRSPEPSPPAFAAPASPILPATARLLAAPIAVVAIYVLWAGSSRPGGAFQAAALAAGAGVLLAAAGAIRPAIPDRPAVRLGLAAGAVVFAGVGLAAALGGRAFLDYPDPWAGRLIVLVETFVAVSLAGVLLALYLGRRYAGGAG